MAISTPLSASPSKVPLLNTMLSPEGGNKSALSSRTGNHSDVMLLEKPSNIISGAEFGWGWEDKLRTLLHGYYGRVCHAQKRKGSPYDLLVDGWRVEVKGSRLRVLSRATETHGWHFNIHRHGVLDERCDFYVFCLQDVPHCKAPVYLLLRAPLEVRGFHVTIRSLLSRYAYAGIDFLRFARGEFGCGPLLEQEHSLAEVCGAS